MRHARRRRRARAAVDPLLSDCDDLPAVRHRSGIPLSMGARTADAWLGRLPTGRALHARAGCGLRVRVEERCVGLESNLIVPGRDIERADYDPDLPVLTTSVDKLVQWARR